MQAFAAAMKMSNLSLGFSYNRDAGLGMNVNAKERFQERKRTIL
ncbi:hypothetical protein [Leptospira sp. mild_001]|nr:hypothetical protein [Leptospira sp. mild_001]